MDKEPFLSIIIPMYNSEKYIAQCLDSILCQDDNDYEVILVDDGSLDDTFEIARYYSEKNEQFHLVRQSNSGTSAARNTGLSLARGQYVTFIDNDDFWMAKDAISSIRRTVEATHAEFIAHEAVIYHDADSSFDSPSQVGIMDELLSASTKSETLSCLLRQNLLSVTVWSKVCSSELIKRVDLVFPSGMRNEDTFWVFRALLHAKSIAWCPESFYAYRCGHAYAQTSKPLTEKNVSDLAQVIMCCMHEMKQIQVDDYDLSSLNSFLAYVYLVWMGQSTFLGRSYIHSKEYADMKDRKWILRYDLIPEVHLSNRIMSMFGFNATRYVLGMYLRWKYPETKSTQR